MNQRAIKILSLSLLVLPTALACSSSRALIDAGPAAEAGAQEVGEDADEIPCEPRRVLQTVCQHCHSLPPQGGAPFPLVRRSDVLAKRSGVVVRELMIQQLDAMRMPLAPVTIETDDREVLVRWLRDGAPATAPQDCAEPVDSGADSEPDAERVDGATLAKPDACPDADADAGVADADASDAGDQ